MRSRFLSLVLLASLALLAGCTAEQRATIGALQELQTPLAEQFKPGEVNVNLVNGKNLVINVLNSPLNEGADAARHQAAESARATAMRHLPNVQDVTVNFVSRRGAAGMHVTNTVASYTFPAPPAGA